VPVIDRPIDENMLLEADSHIGVPADRTRQWWNTVATNDAIRHFAWGMGDDNPLWLDEKYAENSVLACLTAPGSFLCSIDSGFVLVGFEGLARLFAGAEWEWFDRIRVSDSITARATIRGHREVIGKKGGRMILQTSETDYWNQRGDRVANMVCHSFRTERIRAGGQLNYVPRRYEYSAEELNRIQKAVLSEKVRGGETRFWEDVAIGDRVGPLVKGPLTLTDMICWYGGAGPHGRRPHRLAWKELFANPDFYYESSSAGHEFSERGHYDPAMAAQLGMPGPYDNGNQRTAWLGHLITDWMGDAGFLQKLESRTPLPNVFGDTTWITGEVIMKEEGKEGDGSVVIDISGHNQLDELSTSGTAVVILPRRA
jgi:acyl dehydratase